MLNLDRSQPHVQSGGNPATPVSVFAPPEQRPETLKASQNLLENWATQAICLARLQSRVQVRGNHLHILCQGPQAPHESTVVNRLIQALAQVEIDRFLPPDQPQIYQVYLYGQSQDQQIPDWTQIILLNQLEQYLAQIDQAGMIQVGEQPLANPLSLADVADPTTASQPSAASTALVLSNYSLAKQGKADAIARYLSETLGNLGVSVQVRVEVRSKRINPVEEAQDSLLPRRICIYCEAAYSPDPGLVGNEIAHKLRELELEGYQDALIFSEVQGESEPDWVLRVDLMPPDEMLRQLARWGDVGAIEQLLNKLLSDHGHEASASLKDITLHIFCRRVGADRHRNPNQSSDGLPEAPPQAQVMTLLQPYLDLLSPQGIYAAFIYGQTLPGRSPSWVEWFKLPASFHPALAENPQTLARQGDLPALQFLLGRLLNPDLDQRLATGGVRVQIRRKEDLLHIMTDAPVCPQRREVGPMIARQIRKLRPPGIAGVRVYGRRAGERRPIWSYGFDVVTRKRLVPDAMPEFAASDLHLADLIAQPTAMVSQLDTAEQPTGDLDWLAQQIFQPIRGVLLGSQVFAPGEATPSTWNRRQLVTGLTWAAAGVLLAVQVDWQLGRWIARAQAPEASDRLLGAPVVQMKRIAQQAVRPVSNPNQPIPSSVTIAPEALQSAPIDSEIFDSTSFVQSDAQAEVAPSLAPTAPLQPLPFTDPPRSRALLPTDSPYPNFNTPQVNEKLALYHKLLLESGPPDVLIIGSSRSLRGIDPVALRAALAAQGYADVSVFNFGINGATAQVVDLILRRILTPGQLPKVIIWADGARAMNSGREDNTYLALAQSEGYQLLEAGEPLLPPDVLAQVSNGQGGGQSGKSGRQLNWSKLIQTSYKNSDRWLGERLAALSTAYPQRNVVKGWLQTAWSDTAPSSMVQPDPLLGSPEGGIPTPDGKGRYASTDVNGFLALAVQFNPATYFQQYARVSGDFDGDYANFALPGAQTEALTQLMDYARQNEIQLVFVNLPLTAEYLDQTRQRYEVQFQQQMMQLASQQGFTFRNLVDLWPDQNRYFSDPSHLNRYGAYALAYELAKDPLIPWGQAIADLPADSN